MRNQIKQFIEHLAIERRYSMHTQKSYALDLAKLLEFASAQSIHRWDELNAEQLNLFVMQMRHDNISSRSIRRRLSAIRGFFAYLLTQGEISENYALGIKTPKLSPKLPEVLSYEQVLQLLTPRDNTWQELRDVAMIEVIYSCGLRVSELVGLNTEAVDLKGGFVQVLGKGQRLRHVPLGESAIAALNTYLKNHQKSALFVNKSGQRIGVRSVQNMIKKRAQLVGIQISVHPHMLRHAAATHFLQSSHDLRSTQEFLGHQSIKSTQVYTHLDFLELSKVYDQHHPRAKK